MASNRPPRGRAAAPPLDYIAEDLRPLAVALDTLHESPSNARKHRIEKDLPVLMNSLRRFGQRKPIVVRRGTGEIIAGNGTWRAAERLEWSHIAVAWFDGTDEEAQEYALADNRTAELSEWDLPELARQLAEVNARDAAAPGILGWDEAHLAPLLAADWTPPPVEALPGAPVTGPDGTPVAAGLDPVNILTTGEQYAIIRRACDALRAREGATEQMLTDGRCLELIAADYLAGA